MINKLILIFKAKSFLHLVKIFIVFSIAVSLSVFLSNPVLKVIKLDEVITYYPIYLFIKLIIIFPLYQLTLFVIAFIFGEYIYFRKFFDKFFKLFKFR